jgi:hypothetical protein
MRAFTCCGDAPPWTAKLPSLGDSDLPPRAAWHAQQVGHPPRLLHLRRSPATPSPMAASFQLAVFPSTVAASFQLAVIPFPRGGEFPTCRMRAFTCCGDAPPWTAKLPSLGDSDLPPGASWHAQQVGHPPRLLHLRRSPATPFPWRRVFNLPCSAPPWRRVFNLPCSLQIPHGKKRMSTRCQSPRLFPHPRKNFPCRAMTSFPISRPVA